MTRSGREREAKLRVEAAEARRRLEEAGAEMVAGREMERNWVLDTPGGDLRGSDRLLRIRCRGGTWSLTLKEASRSEAGHKIRQEREARLSDGLAVMEALAWAGMRVAWRYQKHRSVWRLGEVCAALDETPLGDFLELEGPEGHTEDAARRLGYDPADFLHATYADLWREAGREGDMLVGVDEGGGPDREGR